MLLSFFASKQKAHLPAALDFVLHLADPESKILLLCEREIQGCGVSVVVWCFFKNEK